MNIIYGIFLITVIVMFWNFIASVESTTYTAKANKKELDELKQQLLNNKKD